MRHEIEDVTQQLEQQVARIGEDLRSNLLQLLQAVEALAANVESQSPDDPATLERTTVLERAAQRLARFKAATSPTFGDSVKLLKQLGKAAGKIRR